MIYVPFEMHGLIHHPGIIGAVILIVNHLIIACYCKNVTSQA
ncbi:hypothetical protein [Vibrio sp. Isolate23]